MTHTALEKKLLKSLSDVLEAASWPYWEQDSEYNEIIASAEDLIKDNES